MVTTTFSVRLGLDAFYVHRLERILYRKWQRSIELFRWLCRLSATDYCSYLLTLDEYWLSAQTVTLCGLLSVVVFTSGHFSCRPAQLIGPPRLNLRSLHVHGPIVARRLKALCDRLRTISLGKEASALLRRLQEAKEWVSECGTVEERQKERIGYSCGFWG